MRAFLLITLFSLNLSLGFSQSTANYNFTNATNASLTDMSTGSVNILVPASTTGDLYYAKELSVLEIREDAIFDKQRSRLYFDIQSITIIIPANKTQCTHLEAKLTMGTNALRTCSMV